MKLLLLINGHKFSNFEGSRAKNVEMGGCWSDSGCSRHQSLSEKLVEVKHEGGVGFQRISE